MKPLLLFFALLLSSMAFAQTYTASDMDGTWKRNDGVKLVITGTSRFAEGSWTILLDVGNSGWPRQALSGYKFRQIKHNGDNTWTAQNYGYSTTDLVWREDGKVKLVMSDDKKTFTAQGFTYTRVE